MKDVWIPEIDEFETLLKIAKREVAEKTQKTFKKMLILSLSSGKISK